jgi:hypothetical protein
VDWLRSLDDLAQNRPEDHFIGHCGDRKVGRYFISALKA